MAVIKYRDSISNEIKKLEIPVSDEILIDTEESLIKEKTKLFIDESMNYGIDTITSQNNSSLKLENITNKFTFTNEVNDVFKNSFAAYKYGNIICIGINGNLITTKPLASDTTLMTYTDNTIEPVISTGARSVSSTNGSNYILLRDGKVRLLIPDSKNYGVASNSVYASLTYICKGEEVI